MFATIVFITFNLLVSKVTSELHTLKMLAKEGLTDKAINLTSEITHILEGETNNMELIMNNKKLDELTNKIAKEEDYELFVEKMGELVKDLYANYQFLQQNPPEGDYTSGYFLGFQVIRAEYPLEYENLFRLAVDKNLNELEINKRFVKHVKEGKVLPLGDAIIDETQTGCSSILQAQEVRVNIVFGTKEYMDKQEQERKERQAKLEEERAQAMEVLKTKDDVLNTLRVTEALANELADEVAEKYDLMELVNSMREGLKAHNGN